MADAETLRELLARYHADAWEDQCAGRTCCAQTRWEIEADLRARRRWWSICSIFYLSILRDREIENRK